LTISQKVNVRRLVIPRSFVSLRMTGRRRAQDALNRFNILSELSQLVILSDRRERRISFLSGGCPEQTLQVVYPELILHSVQDEILRFTQDDRQAKGSG
jgi:hypothetical protein